MLNPLDLAVGVDQQIVGADAQGAVDQVIAPDLPRHVRRRPNTVLERGVDHAAPDAVGLFPGAVKAVIAVHDHVGVEAVAQLGLNAVVDRRRSGPRAVLRAVRIIIGDPRGAAVNDQAVAP
ncbi:MAG: hypothetical protein MZV64_28840 [Ignavibacteriales bacterium]|nr:hypothetical protein [Ignavibacteriales bacterium]